MKNLKVMVYTSLLVSMALAVSLIENMIPLPFIAPGVKLGLSNMVILVTLTLYGFGRGFVVAVLKSFLLMLIIGFGPSFIYSFSGAVFATILMWIALRFASGIFSIIGVSIIGAVAHNFAQLTVASYMLGSILIYNYLPILAIVGMITGYFVGLGSYNIANHLKKLNYIT